MSSLNRDQSLSSLLQSMIFISFSCYIAVARNFSTMLNKRSIADILMLGEKHSVFTTTYNVSSSVFVDVLYQVEEIALYF